MFPARAGMNRKPSPPSAHWSYVPRTSGDEPIKASAHGLNAKCSPHERG